jgi:hypothetical protein
MDAREAKIATQVNEYTAVSGQTKAVLMSDCGPSTVQLMWYTCKAVCVPRHGGMSTCARTQ